MPSPPPAGRVAGGNLIPFVKGIHSALWPFPEHLAEEVGRLLLLIIGETENIWFLEHVVDRVLLHQLQRAPPPLDPRFFMLHELLLSFEAAAPPSLNDMCGYHVEAFLKDVSLGNQLCYRCHDESCELGRVLVCRFLI